MKITTLLPVSRAKYLDRVLESLLKQTHLVESLLIIFDGPDSEFLEVRNKVTDLFSGTVLCVPSNNQGIAHGIPDRRVHISNIHNQARELIGDADWVFSIEDDGVLPSDALERLVKVVESRNVGMVTGVELGRWGSPYVGVWAADDVHNIKELTSLENKTASGEVESIDACGLYCALIRADEYKRHKFFSSNGLGPDVNLGLFLRQAGYDNFVDWNIPVTHLTLYDGKEIEIDPTAKSIRAHLTRLTDSSWSVGRK